MSSHKSEGIEAFDIDARIVHLHDIQVASVTSTLHGNVLNYIGSNTTITGKLTINSGLMLHSATTFSRMSIVQNDWTVQRNATIATTLSVVSPASLNINWSNQFASQSIVATNTSFSSISVVGLRTTGNIIFTAKSPESTVSHVVIPQNGSATLYLVANAASAPVTLSYIVTNLAI